MPNRVFFDTDAFRILGGAFQDRMLPAGIRSKIVLDPLTAIEVLAQLCTREAEVILGQIKALPNLMDARHAPVLPWMDDIIAEIGFGIVPEYSDITDRVGNAIQICLDARNAGEVREAAQGVRRLLDEVKDEAVRAFEPLVAAYRAEANAADAIAEAWFTYLKRRARVRETRRTACVAKKIFEAFYTFEMAKLAEAVGNPLYNADKRRNDAIDVQHLVYLAIPEMIFLTCDRGYARKLQGARQLAQIETSTPEVLRDPVAAEQLLMDLINR